VSLAYPAHVTTTTARPEEATSTESIELGRPSYSWQSGQDRRLAMIREFVPLEGARILDIGCGIGTYVRHFREFSDDVHGVDVEPERVAEASETLPNIRLAPAESLPYEDGFFDLTFLNEVIEHVDDDRRSIREAAASAAAGSSGRSP